jgi:hypothetical protein
VQVESPASAGLSFSTQQWMSGEYHHHRTGRIFDTSVTGALGVSSLNAGQITFGQSHPYLLRDQEGRQSGHDLAALSSVALDPVDPWRKEAA